ncbi:MAG: hypothetical protein KFH87_07990 [Bacteroidetes bacterium]|nr:hypothetical protein [Bacteroidota bacterium]
MNARAHSMHAEVHPARVMQKIDLLLGLRYQPHQWSDLLRLLKPAARELGVTEMSDFLTSLVQGQQDNHFVSVLAKHLTIGESYFFREIIVFSLLRETLIPELLARKEARGDFRLRVWCAGCSTGEEAYSIAILLDSFLGQRPEWSYEILGTDINPIAVQRAREGVYRDWSFRDVPMELHSAYFGKTEEGRHAVVPMLKHHTEFRVLNLVAAPALFPTGFDIIFCRNVLMYFTREKVKDVVQGFRRALREDGWLIPSLTETTLINNPGFEGVRFGDATVFRKQASMPEMLKFHREAPKEDVGEETAASEQKSSLINVLSALFTTTEAPAPPSSAKEQSSSAEEQWPSAEEMHGVNKDAVIADKPGSGDAATGNEVMPKSASTKERVARAKELADAGNLQEALQQISEAIAENKMDPHAHYTHGTILREYGETTAALQSFERALYLHQDFIPAHFSIATLHRQLGNGARARRHFSIALHLLGELTDSDGILEPGEITARKMEDIIHTFLEQ